MKSPILALALLLALAATAVVPAAAAAASPAVTRGDCIEINTSTPSRKETSYRT